MLFFFSFHLCVLSIGFFVTLDFFPSIRFFFVVVVACVPFLVSYFLFLFAFYSRLFVLNSLNRSNGICSSFDGMVFFFCFPLLRISMFQLKSFAIIWYRRHACCFSSLL